MRYTKGELIKETIKLEVELAGKEYYAEKVTECISRSQVMDSIGRALDLAFGPEQEIIDRYVYLSGWKFDGKDKDRFEFSWSRK